MITFVQADNRTTGAYPQLMKSIKASAIEAKCAYERHPNPVELGITIAPPGSSYVPFYASFRLLRDWIATAPDGDMFVWVDSDVHAKPQWAVALLKRIDKGRAIGKRIFLQSYNGRVNTGLFAVVADEQTRRIFCGLDVRVPDEWVRHRYGYTYSADEQIWNQAWWDNPEGFNELIDFLPVKRFCAIPQLERFGNPIPHLQADKDSLAVHFMMYDLGSACDEWERLAKSWRLP